jgi:hypothetical protein
MNQTRHFRGWQRRLHQIAPGEPRSLPLRRGESPARPPRLKTKAGLINSVSHIHGGHRDNPWEEIFGEVISPTPTAKRWKLVALTGPGGINPVTRAVFDHFAQSMGVGVLDFFQ